MVQVFADRAEAGRVLVRHVKALRLPDPLILAVPRGGVPVAAEIALALRVPLDLMWVQKIFAPGQSALAVAAVMGGDHPDVVTDEEALRLSGLGHEYVVRQAAEQLRAIERRRALYLRDRAPLPVVGKTVVLVDDGLATGISAHAAIKALRRAGVARLVLAVPVASAEAVAQLRGQVDDLVCLLQPEFFQSVGAAYADFHEVRDEAVIRLMSKVRDRLPFTSEE